MTASRKFSASTQWAIAVAAIGLGVAVTLVVANVVNDAGWNPWVVSVCWVAAVALATLLVKARRNTGLASRPMGPMGGHGGSHPGDGMHAGDGGG